MCGSIFKSNKRPSSPASDNSKKSDGPTPKVVKNQEFTSQEVVAAKFSGPRTRSQEKKFRFHSEEDVTVSAEEDKGGSEDPEVEEGRLFLQM